MKVLLNCHLPFMFAHGGMQTQIEQTKGALEKVGVTVEHLRWWDASQTGDILHHFGRIPVSHLQLAQNKGLKVILADLLTGQGSRPPWKQHLHKLAVRTVSKFIPRYISSSFNWESYRLADGCIALTDWEAHLMRQVFGAPREKVFVVPNGVELPFFENHGVERGPWLVCSATITERKGVLELAQAAVLAQTPLWIIGKPYAETDVYAQRFISLARENPQVLKYQGAIHDREALSRIYQEARGFVLLSTMESLSLSALEAAACGCPLLLSDLPWAHSAFGKNVSYCPVIKSSGVTAGFLKTFYDGCPLLSAPPRPKTWIEIGERLKAVYETVLKTSR